MAKERTVDSGEYDTAQPESDEDLMARIGSGSNEAYADLVARFLPPLNRYACRLLANAQDAEDLVQETFLRVWSNAGQWQPAKGKLTTWMHRIMHNLCIDLRRRDRSETVADLGELLKSSFVPDSEVAAADQARAVHQALAQLPERQKSAIILCHFQGFSNQDAAAVIGVSIEALESLMARGRRTMRLQLKHLSTEMEQD